MSRAGRSVVVVGGGISGLAAADRLLEAGPDRPQVTLLEASDRLGGVVQTVEMAGTRVDLGADSLVTRSPVTMRLVEELGLGGELIAPAAGQSMVWVRGRLRPVPLGLTAGLPDGVWPLLRSGLLSPRGFARAALDLVLPATGPEQVHDSLGELIRRRFGDEALEHVIDPVLGGIHHGRCDQLSLAVVAPHFAEAAATHRSLLRGVRAQGKAKRGSAHGSGSLGVVAAPAAGVGALTDGLAERVRQRGGEIRLGSEVETIRPGEVWLKQGGRVPADRVILALPSRPAAKVLAAAAPRAATALAELPPVSVTVVVSVHPGLDPGRLPPGNGVLLPASAGGSVRAVSWLSRKWEGRGGRGGFLVRSSMPLDTASRLGAGDELVEAVRMDLAGRIARLPPADEYRVVEHQDALSVQRPGHLGRVEKVLGNLAEELPAVACTGPWMRGSSLGACIERARLVAGRDAAQ